MTNRNGPLRNCWNDLIGAVSKADWCSAIDGLMAEMSVKLEEYDVVGTVLRPHLEMLYGIYDLQPVYRDPFNISTHPLTIRPNWKMVEVESEYALAELAPPQDPTIYRIRFSRDIVVWGPAIPPAPGTAIDTGDEETRDQIDRATRFYLASEPEPFFQLGAIANVHRSDSESYDPTLAANFAGSDLPEDAAELGHDGGGRIGDVDPYVLTGGARTAVMRTLLPCDGTSLPLPVSLSRTHEFGADPRFTLETGRYEFRKRDPEGDIALYRRCGMVAIL